MLPVQTTEQLPRLTMCTAVRKGNCHLFPPVKLIQEKLGYVEKVYYFRIFQSYIMILELYQGKNNYMSNLKALICGEKTFCFDYIYFVFMAPSAKVTPVVFFLFMTSLTQVVLNFLFDINQLYISC